jgi:sulfate/thiosulfate-binding protein
MKFFTPLVLLTVVIVAGCNSESTNGGAAASQEVELLNVSYDPTRELWKEVNEAFIPAYQKETGTKVKIKQSHGSSGGQARSVIDGLEADVVSLAIWQDTDQLRKQGLIKDGWEERLTNRSLPYTSTIVFVVRKGNPKGIQGWPDLVKPGVEIITPNPKTSGNGKLAFLAAYGSVLIAGGTEEDAKEYITKLYKQVPVLDTGARGATTTFSQRGLGDVHLTWENEAHLEVKEDSSLQIIYPRVSILAEPHVAVVDANVEKKKSREAAEAYLKFLYTPEGQEIISKHYYRPTQPDQAAKHKDRFPEIKLFSITEIAKSWDDAQEKFFAEGALFDSIYKSK